MNVVVSDCVECKFRRLTCFVLVEDQKSHVENGELHVEEVAVIRPLMGKKLWMN